MNLREGGREKLVLGLAIGDEVQGEVLFVGLVVGGGRVVIAQRFTYC
jgi:hypothetical protein